MFAVLPIDVEVHRIGVLALVHSRQRQRAGDHVAGLEPGPGNLDILLHDAGTIDDGVAPQRFLDKIGNASGIRGQGALQFGIAGQVMERERHHVGDGVEARDEQQEANRLEFVQRQRSPANLFIEQAADQVFAAFDHALADQGFHLAEHQGLELDPPLVGYVAEEFHHDPAEFVEAVHRQAHHLHKDRDGEAGAQRFGKIAGSVVDDFVDQAVGPPAKRLFQAANRLWREIANQHRPERRVIGRIEV